MKESMARLDSVIFHWIKGPRLSFTNVTRPDGTLTFAPDEMFEVIGAAWEPVFDFYASSQPPMWTVFEQTYASELQQLVL